MQKSTFTIRFTNQTVLVLKVLQMLTVIGQVRNTWVLRLGEMHTVMAALRAVGNAIEDLMRLEVKLTWSYHNKADP